MIRVEARSQSERKHLYRRDVLERIAGRVAKGEQLRGRHEVSVLFCDDVFIAALNRDYRNKRGPTDVLSFVQAEAGPTSETLGDIVISLETVEKRCPDRAAMRAEVRLLFCHGLLHLLGYVHDSATEERNMRTKQAEYLGLDNDAAWLDLPAERAGDGKSRGGGVRAVGRR